VKTPAFSSQRRIMREWLVAAAREMDAALG